MRARVLLGCASSENRCPSSASRAWRHARQSNTKTDAICFHARQHPTATENGRLRRCGVMRKFDRSAAIPIATLLVFLLIAWLGVAGPVVSDAQGKGAYEFLKDWQTLIAALIALAAAAVVARPLWRQLSELQRQADQRSYETLRM